MKNSIIALVVLVAGTSYTWSFFQQRPSSPNIATALCEDKENRCDKCNIYAWAVQYENGEISKKYFEQLVKDEEKWLKDSCNTCCLESCLNLSLADRQKRGKDCSCCPLPPEIGDCDCTDKPNGSRIMCIGVKDGQLEFTVHYCEKGEEIEEKKERFLITTDLPPGSFTHQDSLRDLRFTYIFKEDLTRFHGELPFPKDDSTGNSWRQGKDFDKNTFRVLVPAENDSVYLISYRNGTPISKRVPRLKAEWFDYAKSEIGKQKAWDILHKLSVMTMYSEGFSTLVRLKDINPFTGGFAAKGQVNGKKFLYAYGYPNGSTFYETYFPFKAFDDRSLSEKLIGVYTFNPKLDNTIFQLLGKWLQGDTRYIQAILPISTSFNPQETISKGACMDENGLIAEIRRKSDLSILLETGSTEQYELYDPLSHRTIPLNAEQRDLVLLGKQRHCVLRDLVLADPDLKIIARNLPSVSGSTTKDKLVFFFKGNSETLWSWKPNGNNPNQSVLLRSSDRFILGGNNQEAYLTALSNNGANGAEQAFLLAAVSSPTQIRLLDAFNINYSATRVVLYDKSSPGYESNSGLVKGIAGRLSGQYLGVGNIDFYSISKTDAGWEAFSDRYRQPWAYASFETELAAAAGEVLQAWYGIPERMGILKQRSPNDIMISMKLPPAYRNVFGPANWLSIQASIRKDGIIYTPGGVPANPVVLFKSCLSQNWDHALWRANPLAYFERNKY